MDFPQGTGAARNEEMNLGLSVSNYTRLDEHSRNIFSPNSRKAYSFYTELYV